jgi:cobalamin biosynthesis Mg chelatase CobN
MDNIAKLIDESGLNDERKLALKGSFDDFISIAQEWESKAKEIHVTDSSQKDLMKMAKEGRLLLRQKRLDIENLRKTIKEQPLRECQAIDSVAKAFKDLITPIEDYLKEQEEFEKRENEAKLNQLIHERGEALKQYGVDVQYLDLGNMPQPMFEMLLSSSKITHEQKIKEEKQAEERRLAEQEAERKRIEYQRLENERLRKLAQEQEERLQEERAKADADAKKIREEYETKQRELEAKQKAELEEQRKIAEQERIKQEAKAKREKVEGWFSKNNDEIIAKFEQESFGKQESFFYMMRAFDIIKEVMSK